MARPPWPVADFGSTADGKTAQLYTLRNAHGVQVSITNYGGIVARLLVPDRHGRFGDVVLGFEQLAGYQSAAYRQAGPYFGALIGRYANRIRDGRFTLRGQTYTLARNNHGNALHGGTQGFDKVLWEAGTPVPAPHGPTLTLRYRSAAGEEGYPGNLDVIVVYTLTAENRPAHRVFGHHRPGHAPQPDQSHVFQPGAGPAAGRAGATS